MRLLVTADLHFNHPRSRRLAEDLINQMNAAGGDVLLLVGDTAHADGDALEQALSRFAFRGPKLFVAGNHELWTKGPDSYEIYSQTLPQRVRAMGWHWLEPEPFVADDFAIVGSVGWYDYSFAPASLGIPRRFYERKISPGAARQFEQYADLIENTEDIPPASQEIVARWNDGRFVKLGRPDEVFLDELLATLNKQLQLLTNRRRIIAAIHHLPFEQLLPPPHSGTWDFARAYLGSPRLGELLLRFPNIDTVFCGHSHRPAEAQVEHIHAINIGSGYRAKTFRVVDL